MVSWQNLAFLWFPWWSTSCSCFNLTSKKQLQEVDRHGNQCTLCMYAKQVHVAWGGGFPRYSRYLQLSRITNAWDVSYAVTLLICLIGIAIKEKCCPIKASEWAARKQIVCSHVMAMKWHVEHKEDIMKCKRMYNCTQTCFNWLHTYW